MRFLKVVKFLMQNLKTNKYFDLNIHIALTI